VYSIVNDEGSFNQSAAGRPALQALLQQRGVRVVDWKTWEKMDAAEVSAGQALGASRLKLVSLSCMLEAAGW
jgi:hypothetical protein